MAAQPLPWVRPPGSGCAAYDAWNRLVKVRIDDGDGSLDAGEVDTLVAELAYDGLGRRITKEVKNSADSDCTYHDYYDLAWRRIEAREGSDQVLRQYVWGTRYIDNIVQIGVNRDPENPTQQDCEWFYYPVQDANFNVLGLVSSTGALIERYEYTPYGERTAYKNAGSNDETTSAPLYGSQRVLLFLGMNPTGYAPYGICDVGHQGLFLDPELGLYDNRYRVLHPRLMRFMQRDPMMYREGRMSLYEYCGGLPVSRSDPFGLLDDPRNMIRPFYGGRMPTASDLLRQEYERQRQLEQQYRALAVAGEVSTALDLIMKGVCDRAFKIFEQGGYTKYICTEQEKQRGVYIGIGAAFGASLVKKVGGGGEAGVEVLNLCAPCKICCYSYVAGKALVGFKSGVGLVATKKVGVSVYEPTDYTRTFEGAELTFNVGPVGIEIGVQAGGINERGERVGGGSYGGSLSKGPEQPTKGSKVGGAAGMTGSYYWLIGCKSAVKPSEGWTLE